MTVAESFRLARLVLAGAQRARMRFADFNPDQPRDDSGRWTDTGGGGGGGSAPGTVAPSPHLVEQSKTAIASGDRLLGQAVREADYSGSGEVNSWDDVDSNVQSQIYEQWVNNELENGVDVDMSGVEADMLRDLRRDNDKIIEETEKETLNRLNDAFPNENPSLPGIENDYRHIDPETLTVDTDDGDGAPLVDLDQVRFRDGSELTAKEQALLVKTWNQEYESAIDDEVERFSDSDSWSYARNELEMEALQDQWNSLSESDKLALASNFDIEIEGSSVSAGEPKKWVTGADGTELGSEDYGRTHAIANKMTELRMQEILAERGISGVDPEDHIENVWSHWKTSSHSIESNALQLAASRELGGVHRLSDKELKDITDTFSDRDLAAMQAHVRAQWETTQYVMHRAGQNEVDVYRAIYIPTKDTKVESEGSYTRLPETSLLRAGAQSTTTVADVANNWGGTGTRPLDSSRVVLRVRAPRTSVLSLPVFGDNVQTEYEVVLLGTKDKWRWDLWLHRAPTFQQLQLRAALAYLRWLAAKKVMRKNRKIVIDLQESDRQLPGHWLKGTDPGLVKTVARLQKKLRTAEFNPDQPRDDSGKWTDGGSGEILTPEQQLEKDKRDYLTPDEFQKLPPGIQKWKAQKRKAEAEAKRKTEGDTPKPEPPKPEPEPPKPVDDFTPSVTQREKGISERASELNREGKAWHEAIKTARDEDLERFGPMPANTLRARQEEINARVREIRQTDSSIKFDEAYKTAKREDAAKHGPWLEPDQVKERAELLESDRNWSVAAKIAKDDEAVASRQIPPKPVVDPKEQTPRQQDYEVKAREIARQLGHNPDLIVVRDYAGRTFELNGQTLSEAGHYNPQTGLIELNAARSTEKGIIFHEIQHAQWDYVNSRAALERSSIHSRWVREQAYDFTGQRYFTKDGKVLAKYRDEIEKQTPHLSLLARSGLGSRELGIKPDVDGLAADDGVSDYSKEYWKQAATKGGSSKDRASYFYELAVNETLSEVLRRQNSHNYESDRKYGSNTPLRFKKLGAEITRLYKENPELVRRHFARKIR